MKCTRFRQQRGFGLLDSGIAVVVLGVGVVGLLALNGTLLKDTRRTKAYAEGNQIAQDYLEKARVKVTSSTCTGLDHYDDQTLDDVDDTRNGVNAAYNISLAHLNPVDRAQAPDYEKEIEMAVRVWWEDDNEVVLTSIVNCNDAAISDSGLAASADTLLPPFKTPTGRGEIGGPQDVYPSLETQPAENTITDEGPGDGTYTYVTEEGRVELLTKKYDEEGNETGGYQVLFGFDRLCEGEEFSTVSGKLFIELKNGKPIVSEANLFVLGSDASYCAILPFDSDNDGEYDNVLGDEAYLSVEYQCYFAPEWWGNIGVIRTRNADLSDRIVVGNPDPDVEVDTVYSKEPQLSTTRGYRADREIGTGKYDSVGIGYDESAACDYTAVDFTDHHFVIANITGQETEETVLQALEGVDSTALGDNPGRYYCMLADDGVSCPDLLLTETIPSTTVRGTITRILPEGSTSSTDWPVLTDIDAAGAACETKTWTDNQNDAEGDGSDTYSYTCEIDWEGFTADSWSGDIAFTAADDATLCMTDSTVTAVTPDTETVAYVINDRFATDAPNAISFTDIPRAVTEVELDFDVKADWCGVLGTPNVRWLQQQDNEYLTLTWDAVELADSYLAETCTHEQATPCDLWEESPIESETVDGGTSYTTKVYVEKRWTSCVRVTAQAFTYDDSDPSPVKCVTRSGNTIAPL
jgi:Tfp pilus assembly protein PilV